MAKRNSKGTDLRKKAMLEALESTLGVVTPAAKKVGISRDTHYDWLKSDIEYKRAVEELDNVALDFSESMLHGSIKEKNITAIIFHLKTKGKARGYIEKQEVEMRTSNFDWDKLSLEDRKKVLHIIEQNDK